VVINYVSSASAAEEVAAKARDLGVRAVVVKADVSKSEEIAALFKKAKEELGRVDIVMSNSGIEHFGNLEDVTEEEFDRVFAVNVRAQFVVAQQAHKYIEEGGRLLLIGSVSASYVSTYLFPPPRVMMIRWNNAACYRVLRVMLSTPRQKQRFRVW
jgi:NAD(P)-dependent dehydrogenase (short-subunit alcohol dehydrogenase family)